MTNENIDTLLGVSAVNQIIFENIKDYLTSEKASAFLKGFGVMPSGKNGQGYLLWSKFAVEKVMPEIQRKMKQPVDAAAIVAPEKKTRIYSDLLEDIDRRVSLIVESNIEETTEKVEKIFLGNQQIFKSVSSLEKDVTSILGRMEFIYHSLNSIQDQANESAIQIENIIDNQFNAKQNAISESKPAVKPTAKVPAASKISAKMNVAIIGVVSPTTETIKKEFDSIFNLTMIGPSETNRIAGLKNCDRVFTLRGRVMSRHMNELKSINKTPVQIGDSLTKIRDALTEYFVLTSDKK